MMNEVNSLAIELKSTFGWNQARMVLLAQFMLSLIKVRSSNLTRIAQSFVGQATTDSNYKRLQRFFRHYELDYDVCASVIAKWFCPTGKWVLCLDRTNWDFGVVKINFLVLGVAHQGIAIPLFWPLLPKKGNSNTQERIELINRFIRVFGVDRIDYFTADREFRGKEWLQYLVDQQIPFCLRIPNNTKVCNKHKTQRLKVARLFSLKVGEQMHLNQSRAIWGIPVQLSCVRGKQGLVIIATNDNNATAIERYAVRWSIETLFGCLKSRGFDLEKTHLRHPERLEKLFFVLALSFCWCFKMGQWQHQKKPIKLKKHGRRAVSLFRYGMDYLYRAIVNATHDSTIFKHSITFLSCT